MIRGSKVALLGMAIAASAMVLPSEAQLDPSGLLGLWLCDDGSGDVAADASDNGMDGALTENMDNPGLPTWVDGKFGGGIEFHATGWVETPAPLVVDTRGFSMGCWVKPAETQKAFTDLMSSHQEPPQRGISFEQNNLEHNQYGVAMGGGQWFACGNTMFHTVAGEWNHMVVVRTDDGVMANAYLNGSAFSENQICGYSGPVEPATANFSLGNWILGGREYDGVMDEAFVFNRALTADEVAIIHDDGFEAAMSGGTGVSPSGKLEAMWADLKSR